MYFFYYTLFKNSTISWCIFTKKRETNSPLISSAFVYIAFLSLTFISFTFVCSAFLGLWTSHVSFEKWKLERQSWDSVSYKTLRPTWYDDTSYHPLLSTCAVQIDAFIFYFLIKKCYYYYYWIDISYMGLRWIH